MHIKKQIKYAYKKRQISPQEMKCNSGNNKEKLPHVPVGHENNYFTLAI